MIELTGGATFGLIGGGAGCGGSSPEKGDWLPLTEVVVPYILLGEPGPETRGPRTPGSEKAEDEVGGSADEEPMPRVEENCEDREARLSVWPGGKRPEGVRLCRGCGVRPGAWVG